MIDPVIKSVFTAAVIIGSIVSGFSLYTMGILPMLGIINYLLGGTFVYFLCLNFFSKNHKEVTTKNE